VTRVKYKSNFEETGFSKVIWGGYFKELVCQIQQSVRQSLAHRNQLLMLLKKGSVVQKSFSLSVFATDQNSAWFEQYKVRFIVVILSINRDYEREILDQLDVLLCVVSIKAHLFSKALYEKVSQRGSSLIRFFARYSRVQWVFCTYILKLNFPRQRWVLLLVLYNFYSKKWR
jgi:hypothetical protein